MKIKIYEIILLLLSPLIVYDDIQWYRWMISLKDKPGGGDREIIFYLVNFFVTLFLITIFVHSKAFNKIIKFLTKEIKL